MLRRADGRVGLRGEDAALLRQASPRRIRRSSPQHMPVTLCAFRFRAHIGVRMMDVTPRGHPAWSKLASARATEKAAPVSSERHVTPVSSDEHVIPWALRVCP